MVDRPRGIHLCGNPDWDFLLNLDMDILSMDIYTNADIFSSCVGSIKNLLDRGGVLVWGIIPTGFEAFSKESLVFSAFGLSGFYHSCENSALISAGGRRYVLFQRFEE
jgi:hypothetical protein